MNERIRTHIHIAVHLMVIALAIVAAAWFVHFSSRSVVTTLESQINSQKIKIFELAEITDRNGADDVVGEIIQDCSRRTEYESLLVKLGTLPKKDLISVQNLFESCGSFYAERKAFMVSRLSRELQALKDLNQLTVALHATRMETAELAHYNDLTSLEEKRSTLLKDQAHIQAQIISALISGSTANSDDVRKLVQEAQQIAELLAVHDREVDTLRESLKE